MTVQRLERRRAATEMSVSQLTLTELQAELNRRIHGLQRQREELLEKLAEIDRQIKAVGGAAEGSTATGKQRMSAADYADAVQESLETGRPYSVTELCECLLSHGHNAKKSTLTQGMVAWLVDEGILEEQGKRGRARLYALVSG